MKSYPYIGGIDSDCKTLFLDECYGIVMEHNDLEITGIPEHDWIEDEFTNITHEYLQNTYGKVVSPEHAEFIAKLCESNEIKLFNNYDEGITHFAINRGELIFTYVKPAISSHDKQITIPLPPKQIQTATPEDEFEMEQIMKNAGDNLVLGCEQDFKVARRILNELREEVNCNDELLTSRDEWPKIGNEVLVYSSVRRLAEIKGKAVKVIGKCNHSDGDTILTVEHSGLGVFAVANGSWIKKPKTPEEELRDDIAKQLEIITDNHLSSCGSWIQSITDALLNNKISGLNITKKPQ